MQDFLSWDCFNVRGLGYVCESHRIHSDGVSILGSTQYNWSKEKQGLIRISGNNPLDTEGSVTGPDLRCDYSSPSVNGVVRRFKTNTDMHIDSQLRFVPSAVDGLDGVSEVTVFPDRMLLQSRRGIVTIRFANIARWRRFTWLRRLLSRLGCGRCAAGGDKDFDPCVVRRHGGAVARFRRPP